MVKEKKKLQSDMSENKMSTRPGTHVGNDGYWEQDSV